MSAPRCLFFDLDHTLWDYETNSDLTLDQLFEHHGLRERGVPAAADFRMKFREVNRKLWDLYDRGIIHRDVIRKERFREILQHFGAEDRGLSLTLSDHYLAECPRKRNLMPGAIEVLELLSAKYPLTVVTNGFEEVQKMKMESSGLTRYFTHVVTSERAQARKPAVEIFCFALEQNGIEAGETAMIGDNLLTDIAGARASGIESVYYNPERVSHNGGVGMEIFHLCELAEIF
jgi:putative hydrolase of the HAD superfamily